MLLTLHIKNYALIEELTLEFGPGLIIGTGETGAGKSIIIDALGLILGERASAQAVRTGASRCSVSAAFDISSLPALESFLRESGLAEDPGSELILRREVDAGGKSRAFVNDLPASAAALSSIGAFLIDIHGQHDHHRLFEPAAQRHLLDNFANTEPLVIRVSRAHTLWKQLVEQKNTAAISAEEKQRLIDIYGFQVKEIDDAKLSPEEEEEIEQALPQLKNAEKLGELSAAALAVLCNGDGAALEHIGKAQRLLETVQGLGGQIADSVELIKSAYCQLDETARNMEHFANKLTADPAQLNALLERQVLIHKLKKKYGATVAEVIAFGKTRAEQWEALTASEHNAQELDKKIDDARADLDTLCDKLTAERKTASAKMAAAITRELTDLGMKKARFSLQFDRRTEPGIDGQDDIEFLFSANAGEQTGPLKDIASGGEMSRVMLAVKTVLTKADGVPILVFDEIDAGIGGPTGQIVGTKLAELARHHQVLCITHLPQIAAFAGEHWSVAKHTDAGRTTTAVSVLDKPGRVEEIARMLSGHGITPVAKKHAAELIDAAQLSRQ
ncbi:MAG: DNA repair protein RecN [Elusimicrobia bacterium]|nr:DNA repair protein RecN [Elusimicrobiota bacterium]